MEKQGIRAYNFKKRSDIVRALLSRGKEQEDLFRHARRVRDGIFSKRVEARSVIEYSNICRQDCNYCGMNRLSRVKRYILTDTEFLCRIQRLYKNGRRVIMIQSGESHTQRSFDKICNLLQTVKNRHPDLTLICSLGNLSEHMYRRLRESGVQRYLLKFETSDEKLYKKVKPSDTLQNRLRHIKILKGLGFQVSSGNITGIPGQTVESVADDLLLLKELDLPMGSTSVFIPNDLSNYVYYPPGDVNLALNFTAVLRIICPLMLIPSTSSLELVSRNGQYMGLMAGANTLTLHDGTPADEENNYVIYKKDRYKPKDILFKVMKRAGLELSFTSLIREKPEDTLFYRLIKSNLRRCRPAVYCGGHTYTYRDLLELTSRFCSFLKANKIGEGEVVALAVCDSIEFIVAFLSCIRMGIIAALLDPQSGRDEWDSALAELRPRRILTSDGINRKFGDSRNLQISSDDSTDYFFSLLKRYPPDHTEPGIDRNRPALVLYTSGTTGKPKGVIHTYKDLFVDAFPRNILKLTDRDMLFSCSRLHSSFGLGNGVLFPFLAGAGVILSREPPNPYRIEKLLKLKPTIFFAVPSVYDLLSGRSAIPDGAFSSVRIFVASGENLCANVFRRWKKAYGRNLLECYGSSEMCHPFISNIPGKEKVNSCGKPLAGFKIRFDAKGRMHYKGPSLFAGYYGDDELTRQKISGGWFESDDIGYTDEDGYVFLKGRSNLNFKLRGKWVSALEIEDKLKRCALIKEAAVVAGRGGGLYYYLSLERATDKDKAEAKIRRYCMRNLKMHELPKEINFVPKIPKTANGKINRKILADMREAGKDGI